MCANPEQAESQAATIIEARAGNVEALSELLCCAGRTIRGQLDIAPQWQSAFDLDDVMQVTYVEAYLRIGEFRGSDMRAFRAWLRQIARSNLMAAIRGLGRKRRPQPRNRIHCRNDDSYFELFHSIGATTSTPSRALGRNEAKECIEQALSQLPEDYERVIRLFDLSGLAGPEVAEQMQRSRGAVFMLLARARARLRDLLGSASQFL